MKIMDFIKRLHIVKDDEEGFPPLPEQEEEKELQRKYDEIRMDIYPVLLKIGEEQRQLEGTPVLLPCFQEFNLFFEINGNLLQQQDLPRDISTIQLRNQALQNLTNNFSFSLRQTRFGAFGIQGAGRYTASYLLEQGEWQKVADRMNEDVIVAVPSEELLLFSPISRTDIIAKMREAIRSIYESQPNALTTKLFCFRRIQGKMEPWEL